MLGACRRENMLIKWGCCRKLGDDNIASAPRHRRATGGGSHLSLRVMADQALHSPNYHCFYEHCPAGSLTSSVARQPDKHVFREEQDLFSRRCSWVIYCLALCLRRTGNERMCMNNSPGLYTRLARLVRGTSGSDWSAVTDIDLSVYTRSHLLVQLRVQHSVHIFITGGGKCKAKYANMQPLYKCMTIP